MCSRYAARGGGVWSKTGWRKVGIAKGGRGVVGSGVATVVGLEVVEGGRRVRRWVIS